MKTTHWSGIGREAVTFDYDNGLFNGYVTVNCGGSKCRVSFNALEFLVAEAYKSRIIENIENASPHEILAGVFLGGK